MTGNTNKFGDLKFDYLIVDEACQSTELETLIALQLNPEKVILVGDEKQLPPTVMSKDSQKTLYSRSLFERLLHCSVDKIMLREQYRMHPEISGFPSKQFYEKRLKNHQSVWGLEFEKKHSQLLDRYPKRVNFFDVKSKEESEYSSKINRGEAKQTKALIESLCKLMGVTSLKGRVGIITPYKA